MFMKLNKYFAKQRGIGLLELMLSVAIIAILLIMATRYYKSASQGEKIANSISVLSGIIAAESQFAELNQGSYTATFNQLNLPPSAQVSPWNQAAITLKVNAGSFTMTLAGIPTTPVDICVNYIAPAMVSTGASATCGGGTATVTYPAAP